MSGGSLSYKDRIKQKLTQEFAPTLLEIRDESEQHAGHVGALPGGETHFHVHICADVFEGKTRIERHRLIHTALKEELAERVHALTLVVRSPAEKVN